MRNWTFNSRGRSDDPNISDAKIRLHGWVRSDSILWYKGGCQGKGTRCNVLSVIKISVAQVVALSLYRHFIQRHGVCHKMMN